MNTAKRILLVDDDPDDQYLFSDAVNQIHPKIYCEIANNGAEALTILDKTPPFDLIFMDLNMPKMNGFECLNC
ncbi:MAG: response regulator [Ferruginibacter sp.]|nr:response regulator [Ferruginibacter sp.]